MSDMLIEPPSSDKKYGFVTGRIVRRLTDSADADPYLDTMPVTGKVVFTPYERIGKGTDYNAIIVRETVTAKLDSMGSMGALVDGVRGIYLTVGHWSVSFVLDIDTRLTRLEAFVIDVQESHTTSAPLDLVTAMSFQPASLPRSAYFALPSGGKVDDTLVMQPDGTLAWQHYILAGVTLEDLRGPQGIPGPRGLTGPSSTSAEADSQIGLLWSKGTDMVANGDGSRRNNSLFTGVLHKAPPVVWNGNDAPVGSVGSFHTTQNVAAAGYDLRIPYNPNKAYLFSFMMRQASTSTTATAYAGICYFDADNNAIDTGNYAYTAGTMTQLAADLNPGDTVIRLVSTGGWYGSTSTPASAAHLRRISFWDYTDSFGHVWAPGEYTRNVSAGDYWAEGAVDTVANTITLRAPYSGVAHKTGTYVSNASSGAPYIYTPSVFNRVIPKTWTQYTELLPKSMIQGTYGSSLLWGSAPRAATQIGLVWLTNRMDGANSIHAIANVSFSDAAAAQEMATTMRTARPTSPTIGSYIYDSTLKKIIIFDGSVWRDAMGTAV